MATIWKAMPLVAAYHHGLVAFYVAAGAIAGAYLLWRAVTKQLAEDWRSIRAWFRRRFKKAEPEDADPGAASEPAVRVGSPGGQLSTTPMSELEDGEHRHLTRVVPSYGIWNEDAATPMEHVTSGARTRDGQNFAFQEFYMRRIVRNGNALVQAVESLPEGWLRDVHESAAFTEFLYWVRFTWLGQRWEVVHDPQTDSDWFQQIPMPQPELHAHFESRGKSFILRITNTGTATMWNVDAVLPPEAVNWQFLADALPSWPVEEMAPDDAVTIPIVVTLGQTVAVTLRIRGRSELGPYERSASVSVHD